MKYKNEIPKIVYSVTEELTNKAKKHYKLYHLLKNKDIPLGRESVKNKIIRFYRVYDENVSIVLTTTMPGT